MFLIVVGMVAILERVENAIIIDLPHFLKNLLGVTPQKNIIRKCTPHMSSIAT